MFILNKDKDRLFNWSTKLHYTMMIGSPQQGQSQSVIHLLLRKLQLHFCKSRQRHSMTYKCNNAPKGIQCKKNCERLRKDIIRDITVNNTSNVIQ